MTFYSSCTKTREVKDVEDVLETALPQGAGERELGEVVEEVFGEIFGVNG